MAGGWGNYIMQDQPSFVVLDSFMMVINVFLLACFPPGIFFPQMANARKAAPAEERVASGGKSGDEGHDSEQGAVRETKGPLSSADA